MPLRARYLHCQIEADLARKMVFVAGPRQVGKTTLARQIIDNIADGPSTLFDLEDPDDLARLSEPKLALQHLEGLVVIDEVQRMPDLFPLLRVLVDRPGNRARFLVLGSAGPDLLRQSSETLAGRTTCPMNLFGLAVLSMLSVIACVNRRNHYHRQQQNQANLLHEHFLL